MGISDSILAAMIGAIATVTTALFQIFTAFRNKGKVDARPKRGTTMRSLLAVLALMVASAAGGFLYSEFIKQRNSEDMRAMRAELKELKDSLTASAATGRDIQPAVRAAAEPVHEAPGVVPAALNDVADSVESVVYVPACRRTSAVCTEADAQRIALCGTIPAFARVARIDLFVQPDAVQNAWDEHRAQFEQDLGGARFTGKSFEYAQGAEQKAVCVNFVQWSSDHPHIARILIQYGFGDSLNSGTAVETEEPASMQAPAVIAADTSVAEPTSVAGTLKPVGM